MTYPQPTNQYSNMIPNRSGDQFLTGMNRADLTVPRHHSTFTPPTIGPLNSPASQKGPGMSAGMGANIAMGVGTMALDTINMANQSLDLGNAPGAVNSATGQPYYNVGDFQNRSSGAKIRGVRGGEVAMGGLKGAALGTQIMPGIGTAIGAAVGALGSTIGGWIRGGKQRREKRRALRQAEGKQVAFNEASSDFNQETMARQRYRESMNLTNRMYNLYSQPS